MSLPSDGATHLQAARKREKARGYRDAANALLELADQEEDEARRMVELAVIQWGADAELDHDAKESRKVYPGGKRRG